jgi:hypothetical protein
MLLPRCIFKLFELLFDLYLFSSQICCLVNVSLAVSLCNRVPFSVLADLIV